MLTAWQECLNEAIDRAESIGMEEDAPQALVLIRPKTRRIEYTLRECRAELVQTMSKGRMN